MLETIGVESPTDAITDDPVAESEAEADTRSDIRFDSGAIADRRAHEGGPHDSRRRFTRGVSIATLCSLVPYLGILWNFELRPLRKALTSGAFSNFFDLQARALMHGHLDVPLRSLSIEGFVIQGREFTYFPPGPALLRIPVFLFTNRLDNKFTAISMLLAWIVTAVVSGMLLWRVRVIIRGSAPLSRTEIVAATLVQAAVLCGSVILFLGALPWAYHEVYAWAIALALGAFHSLIGVLEQPSSRRIAATGAFTLGAILCRTTSGWACALTLLGTAVWFLVSKQRRDQREWAWRLGIAGAIPLAIGIAINWAKFRHPFMFPLQDQEWTKVNPHRRAAMAANGGDLVSPNLFWSTSINYLRPNGVRFVSTFPFITLPANVAQSYGGGFLDQTYRTSSITASAPLLVGLAIAGTVATFRRGASAALRLFRIPLIGAAGITGGIMFYGYIAYRYTSEFMPFLIVAAAIGVTVATSRFAGSSKRSRGTYIALLATGLAYGLAANSAFAIQQTYIANPGSMLRNYVVLQDKISNFTGNPLDAYVRQSDSLPSTGPADRLQIVGDCAALFVGTGEPLNPWVPVEIREVALTLDLVDPQPSRQQPAPEIPLATFTGMTDGTLFLQPLGGRRYSLGRRDPDGVAYTEALTAPADGPVSVNIRALTEKGVYVVEVSGRLWFEVAMSQRDADWATFPVVIVPVVVPVVVPAVVPVVIPAVAAVVQGGWVVDSVPTPPALSCTRLR